MGRSPWPTMTRNTFSDTILPKSYEYNTLNRVAYSHRKSGMRILRLEKLLAK